jgi:hypothetical protein
VVNDSWLPLSQEPATDSYPKPVISNPFVTPLFPHNHFIPLTLHLQLGLSNILTPSSSSYLPRVLRVPSITSCLKWWIFWKDYNNEAPRYEIVSSLPSLPPPSVQKFSSPSGSQTITHSFCTAKCNNLELPFIITAALSYWYETKLLILKIKGHRRSPLLWTVTCLERVRKAKFRNKNHWITLSHWRNVIIGGGGVTFPNGQKIEIANFITRNATYKHRTGDHATLQNTNKTICNRNTEGKQYYETKHFSWRVLADFYRSIRRHIRKEKLLEMVFSVRSVQSGYKEDNWGRSS